MKNLTLFALCVAFSFFAACKKDKIDERGQFVGTWAGKITAKVPALSREETSADTIRIVKDDQSTNKIKIIHPVHNSIPTLRTLIPVLGTVNGNSITFDAITYDATADGEAARLTANPTADFDGKTLKIKSALKISYYGLTFDAGAFESAWTKQ